VTGQNPERTRTGCAFPNDWNIADEIALRVLVQADKGTGSVSCGSGVETRSYQMVEDYLFHDIDYVIFPTRSALGWNFEGLQRLCNFYILIDSARSS
jgi:hypothetical protein